MEREGGLGGSFRRLALRFRLRSEATGTPQRNVPAQHTWAGIGREIALE